MYCTFSHRIVFTMASSYTISAMPSSLFLLISLSISFLFLEKHGVESFVLMGGRRGSREKTHHVKYFAQPSDKGHCDHNQRTEKRTETLPSSSHMGRRSLFQTTAKIISSNAILSSTILSSAPQPSYAEKKIKSRSDNYDVQYTDREWAYLLSGKQYNILRQGGTERQYSSILENEFRDGTYRCAGCDTPLFTSSSKFHSGTGWPSYASALPGVEVEDVNPVQANLLGAEIRCGTCGGHLGDVFNDGFIYVNTPAFVTGKRFCVDGAALIFRPDGGVDSGEEDVYGDLPPKPSGKKDLPDFLSPPKIVPRDG